MLTIELNNRKSRKTYDKLDTKHKIKIDELFEVLENNPVPFREYDTLKVKAVENTYRIRIGRYGIEYYLHSELKKIYILKIELRDETTYK